MTKIESLLEAYQNHIRIPWRDDAAAMQRVWFCIYSEKDELSFRAKIEEFELVTIQANKKWVQFDLTNSFANWLSNHPYSERYFRSPNLLKTIMPSYNTYLIEQINSNINSRNADYQTVFAITGVGSLFGLIKVKELIEKIAPLVKGRLAVFFPGSHENNNYRLLDGYDGWNYLAVPIIAE